MSRDSYSAEQWLELATKQLNGLYTLFKDNGWQPDCSLLHGLEIATSQINEALQIMRPPGPDSVGPWKECVYKAKGAPGREDEIRNQECREIAARLRDLQKEVPEHIGGLQEARIAILERMQKREAAIQPAPTATGGSITPDRQAP